MTSYLEGMPRLVAHSLMTLFCRFFFVLIRNSEQTGRARMIEPLNKKFTLERRFASVWNSKSRTRGSDLVGSCRARATKERDQSCSIRTGLLPFRQVRYFRSVDSPFFGLLGVFTIDHHLRIRETYHRESVYCDT